MRCSGPLYAAVAITCGLFAHAASAQATSLETWVSGGGTDSGPCTRAAPCKTFQFAHNQTSAGGSISVLTPGNFGPVSITKSISIVADGVEALIRDVIACPGGGRAAICISAAITVSLRGLTIDTNRAGTHDSTDGIRFTSGSELQVQNTVVRRTGQSGLAFVPSTAQTKLFVSDSTFANNGTNGIVAAPRGSSVHNITIERVRAMGNVRGVTISGSSGQGPVNGEVRDSVMAGNLAAGLSVVQQAATPAVRVTIDHSAFVNNSDGGQTNVIGLFVGGPGATALVGDSTFTGNQTAVQTNGPSDGAIISFGNNKIDDSSGPTGTVSLK